MLISAGKLHGEEKPFPQGVRVQLIRLRSKATWFLVMATLCRMPVVPLFKQLGAAAWSDSKVMVFQNDTSNFSRRFFCSRPFRSNHVRDV